MTEAKTYSVCPSCNQINRVSIDPPQGKAPSCAKCQTLLPVQGGVTELNPAGLAALTRRSPLPVIVDFWAPWCQPCKAFAPTFAQAARLLGGRAVLAKIDTQAHPHVNDAHHIRGIPTLIIFEKGEERSRESGALPLQQFLRWVNSLIQEKRAA